MGAGADDLPGSTGETHNERFQDTATRGVRGGLTMAYKMDWEKKAYLAKPCPFCGSKDLVTENKDNFEDSNKSCTYIECLNCGVTVYGDVKSDANGSYESTYDEAQRAVLRKWNRRVSA